MAKPTLNPRTRAILESYGALDPPAAPSVEKLADEIKARNGELILESGNRDGSRRLQPARATIKMGGGSYVGSSEFDQVATAEAFAAALRGTMEAPNGDVWLDQGPDSSGPSPS